MRTAVLFLVWILGCGAPSISSKDAVVVIGKDAGGVVVKPVKKVRAVATKNVSARWLAINQVFREIAAGVVEVLKVEPALGTSQSNWVVDTSSMSATGEWNIIRGAATETVVKHLEMEVTTTDEALVLSDHGKEIGRVLLKDVPNKKLREAVRDYVLRGVR